MKKIIAVLLCFGLCFAVLGCKKKDGEASGKKITIQIAGTEAATTPQSMAMKEVAKRLNDSGRFNVVVFTDGAMGDTDDVVRQGMEGVPVVVPSDPGRISANHGVTDYGILMAPYVLSDYKVLDKLSETELYKQWEKDFEAAGLKLITNNWYNGMRSFYTNKVINTPSDLKGLRIRGFGNAIGTGLAKSFGYAQTSIASGEIYNAVKQKSLDGAEIQLSFAASASFHEIFKNLTITNHYMLTSSIVCGANFFNSLSPEDQALFVKTFRDVGTEWQIKVAESELADIEKLAAGGVNVNKPDLAPFQEAVQGLYTSVGFSDGLKDKLFSQLGL
ncbi:MAG: C4-dicarboxylate TRAP transporter substrate-binding protein [Termitinemataceae bacterium]|nr:MAG: C4-dicarboxylate TRAP transporter substrate-binding protein [Termitinemataceae bacterium]